jgi:hypothetical protein
MPATNTYLFKSVSLLQQRGLAKLKEIPVPFPVKSFGTENIPQEVYLQWVAPNGIKNTAYVEFVKVKLDWLSHWGNLAAMTDTMPLFKAKLKAHVEADFMVKEWNIKNTLKPTDEQAALMAKWGMPVLGTATVSAAKKQQILNAFYKYWAVADNNLEATGYGPFVEIPPQPYLALLGLANVAHVPSNTSLQGIADDKEVLAYLQKYPNIWLGIPANSNGTLINI